MEPLWSCGAHVPHAADSRLLMLIAVTWFAAVVTGVASQQCDSPAATNIVISVSTKRNATGHWNIAVDVNNEARRRVAARPHERDVALTVGQSSSLCNLTDSVNLFFTASVSSRVPSEGYELIQGMGYYRFSPNALAWLDAQLKCESEGAYLMVINSDLEANVIRELFARKPTIKNHTSAAYMFLGFHDRYKEGDFITVYGTPLSKTGYMQWDSGQPSGGTSHNCGATSSSGKLHSYPCGNRYAYICEFGG